MKLPDSNLIQKKVFDLKVILVASAHYLNSSSAIKTTKDLTSHPIAVLVNSYGGHYDEKKLENIVANLSSNSIPALKNYVELNNGIATLPDFYCKEELMSKKFVRVLPNYTYIKRTLYLLSRQSNFMPLHVKAFKDFLFTELKESNF